MPRQCRWRKCQELAAARAVADGFHVRKGPEQVLAVLFGKLFGFATHAAENLNAGNHVVAIEPVIERIFATAEQNGAVALFRKDTVEIVYPECDAAPGKECQRDKEAGTDGKKGKTGEIRQAIYGIANRRSLRKISKSLITRDCQDIQRYLA